MIWDDYPKKITPEDHVKHCPIIADVEEVMIKTSVGHEVELERLGLYYILQGVYSVYLDVYEKEIFEEKRLLLPYQRYIENLMNTYWAIVDLTCGAYFNAAQMLRLIFENALQTLYISSICNKYDEQLKMIEEGFTIKGEKVRGFRFLVIDEISKRYAWFDREVRRKARRLYGKLSKRTHASVYRLRGIWSLKHNRKMYFFSYDNREFNVLLRLFEEVVEFNFAFLAQAFPRAFDSFVGGISVKDRDILPLDLAKKARRHTSPSL
jgi:hypothetical protein